jgi:hypothetical protein
LDSELSQAGVTAVTDWMSGRAPHALQSLLQRVHLY